MAEESRLDLIKSAVDEFERTQSKFDEFGAADTEPDGEFQHLISLAAAGKLSTVKLTAGQWELYSETPGVDAAADALNEAAHKVVDLIAGCTVGEFGAVHKYLRGYCWRISDYAK
jgi:hypothetical protein